MNIKKTTFATLICATLILPSCSSSESAISYKEAQRYFVRNDVTDHSPRLIKSSEELDRYFGQAAVMGKNGTPTNIDFSKKNAIAIIGQDTNIDTDIKITSIKKRKDGCVTVRYKVMQTGEPKSYSTTPCLLVTIDKKHGGNVEFIKSEE